MSAALATAGMPGPARASKGKPAARPLAPCVAVATVNGVPVGGAPAEAVNSGLDPAGSRSAVGDSGESMSGATALELFRKGLQHATGQGVPMDFIAAHKFFNLAALNGFEAAKERRREIAAVMSREEIAKAQRAAREWLQFAH